MRNLTLLLAFLLAWPSFARQIPVVCGTRPGVWKEEQFLHRQSVRSRALRRAALGLKAAQQPAAAAVRAIGNIAVLDDADGVVSRRNEFSLDQRTVSFLPGPGAAGYRYQTGEASYDAAAAAAGARLPLQDDDSRLVPLPFPFPFFGDTHREVWVNSDGNLTFTAADKESTERSLGRVTAGPPRIAPLFDDLDPSQSAQGVRVLSEAGRFVVSWPQVPEWVESGVGAPQTFQVTLYPDGRIAFAFNGASPAEAVVGIAPGATRGASTLVSFIRDVSGEYAGAVAERFSGRLELDTTTAAQKFYAANEDAYDYLVFFNNMEIDAASGAVAWESTVRNTGEGFGDQPVDVGREFGSRARLQSIMNMGPLQQYPNEPNLPVTRRALTGDTPLTILAHEAGHRFLAYASVRDPLDPFARPMLGYQSAHWGFGFNSDASLLEGNRIRDNGEFTSPRFETTGTVEHFSPLDQYLMGLRGPADVEPEHELFYTTDTLPSIGGLPRRGVKFDGNRRNVRLDEIRQAAGRRTPDHTVAQRRFRFAFILVVREGTEPSASDLARLEAFRAGFEEFFARATSYRAVADTALRLNLGLSVFPAAGVLAGRTGTARVTVDTPPAAPLAIELRTETGAAGVPRSVTIPAGGASAEFTITGIRPGVEELLAVPAGQAYGAAAARINVAAPADVKLTLVSEGPDPVSVRVTDINGIPYPGVRVQASPSQGGAVEAPSAVSGENGIATFRWTPAPSGSNRLQLSVDGAAASLAVEVARVASVVNAASFEPAVAPGSLATVFGANLKAGAPASAGLPLPDTLDGVRVLLDGSPVPLLYASAAQVNFLVPSGQREGVVDLVVQNASIATAAVRVRVVPVAPAVFFDPVSGYGAILNANTPETTAQRPAPRGGYLEIYCTGLGPVALSKEGLPLTTLRPQVSIGGVTAPVVYSGMAPGFPGLYQVNVRVPQAAPSGAPPLSIVLEGVRGNEVRVGIE